MPHASLQERDLPKTLASYSEEQLSKSVRIENFFDFAQRPPSRLVWIQGPSGSGKSFISNQMKTSPLELDIFGKKTKIDGKIKCLTNIDDVKSLIKKDLVISGTSDNTLEVQREVDNQPWDVGFLVARYDLFLRIQAAKARDAKGMGLDPQWIKSWEAKSKYSRRQWFDFYVDKFTELVSRLKEANNLQDIYIILNFDDSTSEERLDGWFGKYVSATDENV